LAGHNVFLIKDLTAIVPSHPFSLFLPAGLRGAIAYALALNLVDQGSKFASNEVIQVLSTTTLVIVLFTIIVFGGSTLPLLKCLSKGSKGSDLTLSKTEDVGVAPAETSEETDLPDPVTQRHQWFMMLDYRQVTDYSL